jgi:SAM-dependent methyltransferase
VSDFLKPGNTYLPHGFTEHAIERFGAGDPKPILAELPEDRSYERVGIDRAMAIAIDLAVVGMRRDATILDVGCSLGTIGILLSSIGYRVTGIDSDVVASVQGWQDESHISSARETGASARFKFVKADFRDFLASNDGEYDVALLLSVVHHWLEGYGYSGAAKFERGSFRETLMELCSRVRSHIYFETPIDDERTEMPPDPHGEFVFPRWFLDARQATGVTLIASTIATNGKPRRLYRIDLD